MMEWSEIFSPSIPVHEIFVRGTVMFLVIYAVMRVAGKREGGVHSLSDLLVVVLVAQAAGPGMLGDASGIADSVLLIVTVMGWSVALDAIAYRWPALAPILKARATPLIVDGVVDRRALRREFMQHDELMSELRLHGITDLDEVSRAYLEPNGMVSVIRADHAETEQPPVPRVRG